MIIEILLVVLGLALLIVGADLLVKGSSNIAKKLRIPEIIIGLTIVSVGTSMPELFVGVESALKGHPDIAIGNIIGSNIVNLLFILGISAAISGIKFTKETIHIDIPFSLLITFIFLILANIDNNISRVDGIIMLLFFGLFLKYTINLVKHNIHKPIIDISTRNINVWKNAFFLLLGVILLKYGADFSVNNTIIIARHFNISEKLISLTVVAIGTGLPELVTTIVAAIKGNNDIAVGNVIGSNIINILLILGLNAVIHPMNYNASFNIQLLILILATGMLLLYPFIGKKDEMSKLDGMMYLFLYLVYMIFIFY